MVVAGNRICVAADTQGLQVCCTLPNVRFMMRVGDGALGTPYTIKAATNLAPPITWTPLLTTNLPALPFEFTDFDVRAATHPQRFYRVRQP